MKRKGYHFIIPSKQANFVPEPDDVPVSSSESKLSEFTNRFVEFLKNKISLHSSAHIPEDPKVLGQYFEHLAINNKLNIEHNNMILEKFLTTNEIPENYAEQLREIYAVNPDIAGGWSRLTPRRITAGYNEIVIDEALGKKAFNSLATVKLFEDAGIDFYELRSGDALITQDVMRAIELPEFQSRFKRLTESLRSLFTFQSTSSRDPRLHAFFMKNNVSEEHQEVLLNIFHSWRFWGPKQVVSEAEFAAVYNVLILEQTLGQIDYENPAVLECFEDNNIDIESLFAGEVLLTEEQKVFLSSNDFIKTIRKINAS